MKSSKIEKRIASILNPNARRRGATVPEALAIAAGMLLFVPLAGLRPAIVQTEDVPAITVAGSPLPVSVQVARAAKPARRTFRRARKTGSKADVVLTSRAITLTSSRSVKGVRTATAPKGAYNVVLVPAAAPGADIQLTRVATPARAGQAVRVQGVSRVSVSAPAVVAAQSDTVHVGLTRNTTVATSPAAQLADVTRSTASTVIAAPAGQSADVTTVTTSNGVAVQSTAPAGTWNLTTARGNPQGVTYARSGDPVVQPAKVMKLYRDGRLAYTVTAGSSVSSATVKVQTLAKAMQNATQRHASAKELRILHLQLTIAKAELDLARLSGRGK